MKTNIQYMMKKGKGQYMTPTTEIVEVKMQDFLCISPGPYSLLFLTMSERDDYDPTTDNPFAN